MAVRCPHLGLAGSPAQALLLPSPHHRCYVSGQPERVARAYQAEVCLTLSCRRCIRLGARAGAKAEDAKGAKAGDAKGAKAEDAKGAKVAPEICAERTQAGGLRYNRTQAGGLRYDAGVREQGVDSRPVAPPEARPAKASSASPAEQVAWLRPSIRRPELQAVARADRAKPRHPCDRAQDRPLTATEMTILSLVALIVFSGLFIGYAILYRVQVGPGMSVPTIVAGGAEPCAGLPSAQAGLVARHRAQGPQDREVCATLVPTFTPTPSPTAPPAVTITATWESPTPIPEPTLALPTPFPCRNPEACATIARVPASAPPTRLVIPKLALDIPVLPVGVKTIHEGGRARLVWADVPNAGGFHQTSAYPGNPGNTVINGHRDILGAVFRHLDRLAVGDEITLYVEETPYLYYVSEVLVVPETFASPEQRAENLRLIGTLPEERLTLVTCTPVGLATHRLLVIARPPEQLAPEMPEAGSGSTP